MEPNTKTKDVHVDGLGTRSFQVKDDQVKVASVYKGLDKELVDFAAYKIDRLGVFSTVEINTLKKMGMVTVQDLDAFSTKIQGIIDDIMKAEGAWLVNFTENDKKEYLKFEYIKMACLYPACFVRTPRSIDAREGITGYKYQLDEPLEVAGAKHDAMLFLVKDEDKAAFDNVSNAPCCTVNVQYEGINAKLNLPVFTVTSIVRNEELSKLLEARE